jgi:hypothetical protein
MGDCRIRLDIAKELLLGEQQHCQTHVDGPGAGVKEKNVVTVTRIFSADTTIREVAESIKELWNLLTPPSSDVGNSAIKIWDCTLHPPKDISDWPLTTYPDVTGPRSKTLHDAGIFPSGLLLVLPKDVHPNDFSRADYDDVQYSNKQSAGTNGIAGNTSEERVLLRDSLNPEGRESNPTSRPLPSQVFKSVASRFEADGDDDNMVDEERAKKQRRQNQEQQRQIQQMRTQKLNARIEKLEKAESGKNKAVSEQIRRMLVKSRATGEERLKMQDRIYFQCFIDKGSDEHGEDATGIEKDYRFFSHQDTAAKIASSFHPPTSGAMAQVLLLRPSPQHDGSSDVVYRRIPVTMRIYEAVSKGILSDQEVDTLVIRWSNEGEALFPSVVEEKVPHPPQQDDPGEDRMQIDGNGDSEKAAGGHEHVEDPDLVQTDKPERGGLVVDDSLNRAIREMDEANAKGGKPRKASAASSTVRNMQIKSKAHGDKKRIPNMENRFFLEIVLVTASGIAKSTFQFLAKTDTIERILQNVASSTTPADWDFYVPTSPDEYGSSYVAVDASVTVEKAESEGIMKPFDRLILRSK